MNIAIITIQGLNYGSFLQGFALRNYLEKIGHNVSFINTLHPKQFISSINSLNITFEIKNKFAFLSAWKKQKTMSRLRHYDAVVIGSDVVWAKNKKIYYGSEISADKKIAYAPSCSGKTYNNLKNYAVAGIKNFDFISTRDKQTAKMVQQVTGIEPPIVTDPTFLIDWKPYEKGQTTYDDYVLVYSYAGKMKSLRKKAFALGKHLISVGNYLDWCDLSIPDASPFEFLTWVKNAEFILTDTFHGTVFSIIYQRPFASFPRSHKTRDLLTRLHIPEKEIFSNHQMIVNTLKKQRNTSIRFLQDSLDD